MSFCKHRVMDRCKKYDRMCIFSPDCFEPEEEKSMTNADRIRSMSDEELIGFLVQFQEETINRFAQFELPNYNALADWLQQPLKGE